MAPLAFRPYTTADADACLALFDGNVPTYFDASERADYAAFLAAPPCEYLVGIAADGTVNGTVLACGGWFVNGDGSGGLAWGIVARVWHRRGLGLALLEVRMAALRARPDVERVIVRTSQHTEGFFARVGFAVTRRVADAHAPGIDLVEMCCVTRPDAGA